MAYYKPCKNCAIDKAACEVRQTIRNAIKGLSVYSVNFRCDNRKPMFRTGQRVEFRWRVFEMCDYGADDETVCHFRGTVIHEQGSKFIVRVDQGKCETIDDGDWDKPVASSVFRSLIIKVRPEDMIAIDQPDRKLCLTCASYADEEGRCHRHGRPGHWDSYWPAFCLKRPA